MAGRINHAGFASCRSTGSPWGAEGLIFVPVVRNSMKKRIKINGVIIFVTIIMLAAFPFKFLRMSHTRLDGIVEVLGIGLILLGQLLRISSRGLKADYSQEGKALVKTGPYLLVRNPMYLGIVLIGLGVVLALFNWWVILIFAAFFVVIYTRLIFKEEKKLVGIFGEEYLQYQRNVPRLFPGPRALIKSGIVQCLPLKLSWVKKEIGSIFVLLTAVLFIDCLRDIRSKGWEYALSEFTAILSLVILFLIFAFFLARSYENIAGKS
jgi:protein-S-isoprenylcysteine O-methyltransferase Ste14